MLHRRIIAHTGGLDGVRDLSVLESAIAAPLQSFAGNDLFPSDMAKIARLGYGLAANHAFCDGNKCIGALVTQLLCKWNGYVLCLKNNELSDMFISIADGQTDTDMLELWLEAHICESNPST